GPGGFPPDSYSPDRPLLPELFYGGGLSGPHPAGRSGKQTAGKMSESSGLEPDKSGLRSQRGDAGKLRGALRRAVEKLSGGSAPGGGIHGLFFGAGHVS